MKFKDSCGVGFIVNTKGKKSYSIIDKGLRAVSNLTHRGATLADGRTGDGSGILIQIPHEFFINEAKRLDPNFQAKKVAIGTFFLKEDIDKSLKIIEKEVKETFGSYVIREVPIDKNECGKIARKALPEIIQVIVPAKKNSIEIYLLRRKLEKLLKNISYQNYVVSFSDKLVVYKGMLLAPDLKRFYLDLQNEELKSSFAIFHQRYSTNTNPEWKLAQPLRLIAHNGEINTITANRNFIKAVEPILSSSVLGKKIKDVLPLVDFDESDSASLDRVFELMVMCGIDPAVAINVLIPPAYELLDNLNDEVKAFFQYAATLMKPWDGPAAITFTDGKVVGGKLDRNGLRPARYIITEDTVIFGSEVGMIDIPEEDVKEFGRLKPGETILIDTETGTIEKSEEILNRITIEFNVSREVRRKLFKLKNFEKIEPNPSKNLNKELIKYCFYKEDLEEVVEYMAEMGKEPVFSMGDDTPIPNLLDKPYLLFKHFKQRFAQVTNPPIDPIREKSVMSLKMKLGAKENFLELTGKVPRRLEIDSPLLTPSELKKIKKAEFLKVREFRMEFEDSLKDGLKKLFEEVKKAIVEESIDIVILSDKNVKYPIPSLLAVSGLSNFLEKEKLLSKISIIVETGEVRDTHQVAALIAFGAAAVHPYLVFEYLKTKELDLNLSYHQLEENYKKAINNGILKIMSKMGISLLSSYHRSQLFDIVGISKEVVEQYFPNTFSPIGGVTLDDIEKIVRDRVKLSEEKEEPEFSGELKFRPDGIYHSWNPEVVRGIFKAARSGKYEDFKKVVEAVKKRPTYIRDLLKIKSDRKPIPIEEVEPIESIVKRLMVPGMSVGALSKVAHEVIAEAMNILGAKSCSGEGGEDPERYGTIKNSKIKQVASGRFGVTPSYLASAEEIEIKLAQGAKPGEGGHLPGHKVTPYIASLRFSVPGVALISPPPHHDIYSIEDLAQLIYDLKLSNPKAKIAVKLVAESGVGTVASGVAKAKADIVQISGASGGTGASPLSSIKGAGMPWEIGLPETHKNLVENNLRENVVLRVDGGFKIGRDVVIAALMGAEEFGFGTAAMIAEGCVMDRECHTNRCPVGIATQDEAKIKRFRGAVESVVNYFKLVAEDIRHILAEMGYRSLEEIIGRYDLLEENKEIKESYRFAKNLDLSFITESPVYRIKRKNYPYTPIKSQLNEQIVKDVLPYLERREKVFKEYEIKNTDRSVGVLLGYHVAKSLGKEKLSPNLIHLRFKGVAGQSFGAFLPCGITLELIGEANDYVGKGLGGGTIILKFPKEFKGNPHENVIAGNTLLYGATGGALFASGIVGERFAVRNSGAIAVVEGAGQHACEYMVRGIVVILGKVGKNFGAGMTGGTAFVLDRDIEEKINKDYVEVRKLNNQDFEVLKSLLSKHYKFTRSKIAAIILENRFLLESIRKIVPIGVKELEVKLSGIDKLPE
ncbi:glutamate synthase large subunit [Desulfurobacterium thermolithotrophum]|uniref:glutamate synthase large subunit n=1 Tax=Desulfurobacterium thermolithotrophum TaxID=64160 RepID=UPI0013D83CD0|nr:glutamate synthase large subunit [Desulfurobacterium thermolithotrophum]